MMFIYCIMRVRSHMNIEAQWAVRGCWKKAFMATYLDNSWRYSEKCDLVSLCSVRVRINPIQPIYSNIMQYIYASWWNHHVTIIAVTRQSHDSHAVCSPRLTVQLSSASNWADTWEDGAMETHAMVVNLSESNIEQSPDIAMNEESLVAGCFSHEGLHQLQTEEPLTAWSHI